MGSLALRPGDSLTIPKMALSVGFIRFVSSTNATQATGLLTLTPVGLTPTEHASLCWTHSLPIISFILKSLIFSGDVVSLARPCLLHSFPHWLASELGFEVEQCCKWRTLPCATN